MMVQLAENGVQLDIRVDDHHEQKKKSAKAIKNRDTHVGPFGFEIAGPKWLPRRFLKLCRWLCSFLQPYIPSGGILKRFLKRGRATQRPG
jgi:hypothetical protein